MDNYMKVIIDEFIRYVISNGMENLYNCYCYMILASYKMVARMNIKLRILTFSNENNRYKCVS